MTDRPSIEKEITDTRRAISQLDREIKQLRDWISSNERGLGNMNEALRRITEEGIVKARADLAYRENDAQRYRSTLAANERLLGILTDIDQRERDITSLEREQEKIIVLLERQRTELRQLQMTYEELTRPPIARMPCELVLPNNQRVPLDFQRTEYLIGWHDATSTIIPDIDLNVVDGGVHGVSRRHAFLRYNNGQWTIEDLGSTNGTFLNESPVTPHTQTILQDKTTIRLGSVKIFFRAVTQTARL